MVCVVGGVLIIMHGRSQISIDLFWTVSTPQNIGIHMLMLVRIGQSSMEIESCIYICRTAQHPSTNRGGLVLAPVGGKVIISGVWIAHGQGGNRPYANKSIFMLGRVG